MSAYNYKHKKGNRDKAVDFKHSEALQVGRTIEPSKKKVQSSSKLERGGASVLLSVLPGPLQIQQYQKVQLSERELSNWQVGELTKELWAALNKLVLNSLVYGQFMTHVLVLIKMYDFNVRHP